MEKIKYLSQIIQDAKNKDLSMDISKKITKIEDEYLIKYGRDSINKYQDQILNRVCKEYNYLLKQKGYKNQYFNN